MTDGRCGGTGAREVDDERGGADPAGLLHGKDIGAGPDAVRRWWSAGVSGFTRAVRAAEELRTRRSEASRAAAALPAVRERWTRAHARVAEAEEAVRSAEAEMADAVTMLRAMARTLAERQEVRQDHWDFRPDLADVLFSFGRRLRRWQRRDDALARRVEDAEQASDAEREHLRTTRTGLEAAEQDLRDRRAALARAEEVLARTRARAAAGDGTRAHRGIRPLRRKVSEG
ncbi:DNA repair exonuclease SbcCD ATPase subunit [Spinactinospora alkalitolerans]|uniref:DNA repair exonuclease SbcCD ATPase subunit n=1 Tax=Spinactinospora alkalitolerans TaxID=687207 RepID=A0A852TT01_9ACTN|nr:hypothetical protein [Spinactinospora alkalitolerans]NYE45982.1 DNA repair exonuclease SbcCD ATPase subunit [Spinactinospora alkalitolerans]